MADQVSGMDPAHAFERLAGYGCPPRAELLSAAGAAVAQRPVTEAVDPALDELGRRLFGAASEDANVAAERLGGLLATDPGFAVDRGDPRALMLDWVLEQRVGHPLLLAVVVAEAGTRAGIRTGVFSSRHAWYAGVGDSEGLWLVETIDDRQLTVPRQLRGHCTHELAWAALTGIVECHRRRGEAASADRARRLSRRLPVGQGRLGAGDPLELLWADST